MRDLSLHILDIVMNSINAKAEEIEIKIIECEELLKLTIKDNGIGIKADHLSEVLNPFYTTRKTRKVGLGLSLLNESVKRTNGYLSIQSKVGEGTVVEAIFNKNHLDCIPLGNIDETIISLIILEPNIDYIYYHNHLGKEFWFNTKEIKSVLAEVPINEMSIINWIKANLKHKFD